MCFCIFKLNLLTYQTQNVKKVIIKGEERLYLSQKGLDVSNPKNNTGTF